MKTNYINISGRTLSLTGGRMLPPFGTVELKESDYDYKLVQRGSLQEQIKTKPKTQAKKESAS